MLQRHAKKSMLFFLLVLAIWFSVVCLPILMSQDKFTRVYSLLASEEQMERLLERLLEQQFREARNDKNNQVTLICKPVDKKFVVITTKRSEPSPQLRQLAEALQNHSEGWSIVVVSLDSQQNQSVYTSLPKTVFLSVESQQKLPFVTARLFSEHSLEQSNYARKNLGYLYAMLNGGRVILDADDSLDSLDPEGFASSEETRNWREIEDFELYSLESRVEKELIPGLVNHYHHFGLATFTPRGYFRNRTSTTYRPWLSPRRNESTVHVSVQMGLVKRHPDLSSKIVNKDGFRELTVRWNPLKDSIAFAKGTFGVLHSSPAWYHQEAFFSMMLPAQSGLSRAVVDVWRGFVTQRLLWAFDSQIGYVKSNNTERDLKSLTDEMMAQLDESGINLSSLFEPLLKALISIHLEASATTWHTFEHVYQKLYASKLVDEFDLAQSHAWAVDIKLLQRLDESFKRSNSSEWNFEEYIKESRAETPVVAFSHKSAGKKKFIYTTQTDLPVLPPRLSDALPEDVDLLALNYRLPAENMIFVKDTWTVGRNVLLQEVYLAERYRGYQYDFVLMMDDDVKLYCKEISENQFTGVQFPSIGNETVEDMRRCYQRFQDFSVKYQSALLLPAWPHELRPVDVYGTYEVDAFYNSFHREAMDQILPYNTMIDKESWWSSQKFVIDTGYALYANHVYKSGTIYGHNTQSRPYPRGLLGFDRVWAAVYGSMPTYMHSLNGEMGVTPKNRHYGDVCSCDVSCERSLCRTVP